MRDSQNDKTVTHKMDVTFKNEDEYQKLIKGETHSDKGIRTNKGRLRSQPDIKAINEAESDSEYAYQQDFSSTSESYEEYGVVAEIFKSIIDGLVIGVGDAITEFFSDEKKIEVLVSRASNWWHGKFIVGAKKTGDGITKKISHGIKIIRSEFPGKTKAEQLLSQSKECTKITELAASNPAFVEPVKNIDDKSHYRESISMEEAQRQYDQIKVLAILLADKIKNLSSSYIRESDMSPDDYLVRKNTIEELTSREVMNSIKLLLENDGFSLDNSTLRIFSEFLAGNIIVGDRLIPIDNYTDKHRCPC